MTKFQIGAAIVRRTTSLLVAVLLGLLVGSSVRATQVFEKPTPGVVGFKFGIISGTDTRGDIRIRTNWDKSLQLFGDVPIARRVAMEVAIDFHSFHANRVDNWMIDLNVAAKPTFRLKNQNLDIKPGLAVGFGHIGEVHSYFEDTNYLTVRPFVEACFDATHKWTWLAEFSVLFTPQGGRNDFDLRVGPVFMFRFGIGLR